MKRPETAAPRCSVFCYNSKKTAKVKAALPPDTATMALAAFFGAFSDQKRLQPYCKSFVSGFTISSIFSAAASWEWAITCP